MLSEPILVENPQESKINRIAIRAIYPSRLKYSGAISSEAYEWEGAGAIVMVRTEDTPYLLNLRIGSRSCCGGTGGNGNKVFESLEEST